MTFKRLSLGRDGESAAEKYLLALGYRLLERSSRSALGEIDLVMQDGETIVFVEVKSRGSREFGLAEEAVGPRKQRKIAQAAVVYVKKHHLEKSALRFDVIAIQDGQIRHTPDAFRPGGYRW